MVRLSIKIVGVFLAVLLICVLHTPIKFLPNSLVTIPSGASFFEVASLLEKEHIITSPLLLRVFSAVLGGTKTVQAGEYFFEKPEGAARVAWRLTRGVHGLESVRVVLPEGLSVAQMGDVLARELPRFDADAFVRLASGKEGYLFPDTYFFAINATPEAVIAVLSERFDVVAADLGLTATSSQRSMADVVTMASILEKEAKTFEEKQIIAGILWKRLAIGMALQVDAAFMYTLGKASHELTSEDLETDSPYNTYTRTGLPLTPISNPGRESLEAALSPTDSEYFFYLTGNDGNMYYAEDFDGHKRNKAEHL